MITFRLRNLLSVTLASAAMLSVTACHSDDDEPTGVTRPTDTNSTGTGTSHNGAGENVFALCGELAELKYAACTGDWEYADLTVMYLYTFDSDHLVSLVTGARSGGRNPITYGSDQITILHNDGDEGTYVYTLEDGRITSCSRNGQEMYRWEYDSDGRVIRAVSLLTGGGVANSYRATWDSDGNLCEVVCEEISDYTAGRDNFGDRWTFSYTTTPMLNPIVVQIPLQQPAATADLMFGLKLTPVLLAEGYYGNTSPSMLPSSMSYYDASLSTEAPYQVTDYRYTLDAEGRVTRTERMYTQGVGATSYYYGSCQTYSWR